MPQAWAQNDSFQLLLLMIEQSQSKLDWAEIATKMGRTVRSVTQQYNKLKKMNASVASDDGTSPAKSKKRTAKEIAGSPANKKAKTMGETPGYDDDDEDDQESVPNKHVDSEVKVEKIEDDDY